jgi:hypothetical protein
MSKKINQLDAATDAEAMNDSYVLAQADPINGVAKKLTVAQAKEVYGVKRTIYTCTGSEGTSVTIPALSGRQILVIGRGLGFIYEVGSAPASDEYTWDDTTIGLGTATNTGEKFIILHRTY